MSVDGGQLLSFEIKIGRPGRGKPSEKGLIQLICRPFRISRFSSFAESEILAWSPTHLHYDVVNRSAIVAAGLVLSLGTGLATQPTRADTPPPGEPATNRITPETACASGALQSETLATA